jgi:hypothetical protein
VFGLVKPVGFDQKILLHQLDYTAKQSRKQSKKDMYDVLDGFLRQDITGAKSRKNVITILMKIWYNTPEEMTYIREEILQDINELTTEERLFVHWNMTMVAYPFFKDVVNEFGRLFQLQNEVPSSTIVKRMKDAYGDKRRVEVATGAVISSLKAWEIIKPAGRNAYRENEKIPIYNSLLHALLLHALLYMTENESLYANMIPDHPLLFPFEVELQIHELMERKNEFAFHYQGVEKLIVEKV